jgi:hypothetical protein
VRVELGDRPLQLLKVRQGEADEQRVVATKPPSQRLAELGKLARSRPLASSASTWGSRSPATSASSIARPEAPSTSVATESSLMPASSKVFWMR